MVVIEVLFGLVGLGLVGLTGLGLGGMSKKSILAKSGRSLGKVMPIGLSLKFKSAMLIVVTLGRPFL